MRYWAIIWCTVCHVKNFEINLSFLIKPFFCTTKMSRQINISKTKRASSYLFTIFKGLSVVITYLRSECGPLKGSKYTFVTFFFWQCFQFRSKVKKEPFSYCGYNPIRKIILLNNRIEAIDSFYNEDNKYNMKTTDTFCAIWPGIGKYIGICMEDCWKEEAF